MLAELLIVISLGTRVRVWSPIRNPTMDVAGFPNRFCILLDFQVCRGGSCGCVGTEMDPQVLSLGSEF